MLTQTGSVEHVCPGMFTQAYSHSYMRRAERLQALGCSLQLGEPAAFLFDEVILDPAAVLGRLENSFPVSHTLPEQHLVAFGRVRRPVFAVDRVDAPRVRSDPCHWVGAPFQASSDGQL